MADMADMAKADIAQDNTAQANELHREAECQGTVR